MPLGVDGLYAQGAVFADVVGALSRLIRRAGGDEEAVELRFPAVMARTDFVRTGYLRSFPSLVGSVDTFLGDDRAHRELLAALARDDGWADHLVPAEAVLCSAACHPLYPTLSGVVGADARRFDIVGTVFRHEPSTDPARMQSFHMHERVLVGSPQAALGHGERWQLRAMEVLGALGLDVRSSVAHDPFFGRIGALLAASQTESGLKTEVLGATGPEGDASALASVNLHEDHFGKAFGVQLDDGAPAHSACAGFGLERVTLALLWEHGLLPEAWPTDVRAQLWP